VVGDFLIESRCRSGHTSSALFRRYTREHVERVAWSLSDRCSSPIGDEDEKCGDRVHHLVTAIPYPPDSAARAAMKKTDTKPSMSAVSVPVVIVDDTTDPPLSSSDTCPPEPGSSEPPTDPSRATDPPLTEEDET
jgi:hypothetical protein